MGYETHYDLKIEPDEPVVWERIDRLRNGDHHYWGYALGEHGESEDSCTWYKHEEDVAALSAEFPSVLFTLHGEGEEQGDEWYKYFKGGKVQTCEAKITFDPYDESKLVEPERA